MKTDQDTARERNAAFLRRCWQDGQYYTERGSMFYTQYDRRDSLSGPIVFVGSNRKCVPMTIRCNNDLGTVSLLVAHTDSSNGQHSYAWIHA